MKKAKAAISDDAPLGSFEEQVLLAVARLAPDAYAVPIRREIEEQTSRRLAMGAVYATLDRLEAKALVSSKRQNVNGMSRRIFAPTAKGIVALEQTRAMRDRLWDGLDLRKVGLRFS